MREIRAEAANDRTEQLRLEVSQDMLNYANSDHEFLNIVTTCDESWVYGYDPETKAQSTQWKHSTSPRPKKVRQVQSNVKVMLTVCFYSCGMVHREYAPQGQNINKEYTWKSFVTFVMHSCGQRERGRCITTTGQLIPRN